MPSVDTMYRDERLTRYHRRILAALLGVERSPDDLLRAGVVGNRNALYRSLKELQSWKLILSRKDPLRRNRVLYTALYYTPVPRFVGWQRYLLEPQLTKYRNAARLGLYLFYYCVEHKKGIGEQCLYLAGHLGIKDFVSQIMHESELATTKRAIDLLRRVDVMIRDHEDKITASAFAIAMWISVASRLARNREDVVPSKRITDELRILTGEQQIVDYVKESLDSWFGRNEIPDARMRKFVNQNGELFFQILAMYVATYGSQHTQGELLQKFFEERTPLSDEGFQLNVKPLLARYVGRLVIRGGSGSFAGITKARRLVKIRQGERLTGGIRFELTVNSPEPNVVPLVEVRTWLPRETENEGWVEVAPNIPKRFERLLYPSSAEWQVDCPGPAERGLHYLFFLFGEETNCEFLASKTVWPIGYPVWNDGCDIADFKEEPNTIENVRRNHHLQTPWLLEHGYAPKEIAIDAVGIEVV